MYFSLQITEYSTEGISNMTSKQNKTQVGNDALLHGSGSVSSGSQSSSQLAPRY